MDKISLNTKFQNRKHHLSDANKEVLTLYLEQNLSQIAIAEKFSVTSSEMKKKISRALLELRKISNDPDYIKAMKILKE